MYIVKNALRCIARSKGRNILIGIIALVIAISACLGLSIRQAAESAKASALEGMSVTASISFALEENLSVNGNPFEEGFVFDKDSFESMLEGGTSLSLDEYLHYATASTVNGFYYTVTSHFNGSEGLEKVSTSTSGSGSGMPSWGGSGMPSWGGGGRPGASSGDFTVIGYSSWSAMTDFVNSTASILEGGSMFVDGTSDPTCVISKSLATYNGLDVGDTIVITNTALESETFSLTICGIYTTTQSSRSANSIYMSASALEALLDTSAEASGDNAVTGDITATYTFATVEDFEVFKEEVYTMGLDESYSAQSSDLMEFEESLTPLNTLSDMAGWFLIIILIIGGVILVVLNIFNVRERKYEVGVLTAMGMKKWKVAAQFICEILVVTMIAIIIGAGIGAVSSVPITNALLENQINSKNDMADRFNTNFNPSGMIPGGSMPGGSSFPGGSMPGGNMPGGGKNPISNMLGGAADYITEVNSAMNLTVVFQMIGVGLLLTLVASAASVLFIMRYDPLKILANRD